MPRRRLRWLDLGVLLAASGTGPPAVLAASGLWASSGPYGGQVWALAVDPTNPATVYAGTHLNGVFKTTDGGVSWHAASSGIGDEAGSLPGYDFALLIRDLAIVPEAPLELYAGTFSGVFKSIDGAESWFPLAESQVNGVFSVAVAPSAPEIVYLGTISGVFRSTDGGDTWEEASDGLGSQDVISLAVDLVDARRVYAVAGQGVFKTTNGGVTWEKASNGLPPTVTNGEIAVDPTDPSTLFLAIDAGVYKSLNEAAGWELLPLPTGAFASVVVNPENPDTVYAGSYLEGLYKSEDGGQSWVRLDSPANGFFDEDVMSIALDPFDPFRVHAGVRGAGVFRSNDGGDTWTLATNGLAAFLASSLVVDPETSSTLYTGGGVDGFGGGGVWKSIDGGESWEPRPQGLTSLLIQDLEVNPQDPAILYAGTINSGGVQKSVNGGESWAPVNNGISDLHVEAVALDPLTPETVYAGAVSHLFKTTDGGQSWSAADTGLDAEFMVDIAINPVAPENLFVATHDGLFMSANGAASWSRLDGFEDSFMEAVALDPRTPCTLYADYLAGLGTSTDCGSSWDVGPPGGTLIMVEVDPVHPDNLYATARFDGLYRSTDGGKSWEPFNEGLANVAVQAIAFDPQDPELLYAATLGGVYERRLDGIFADGFESGDSSAWSTVVD